jgi:hypothetical protein
MSYLSLLLEKLIALFSLSIHLLFLFFLIALLKHLQFLVGVLNVLTQLANFYLQLFLRLLSLRRQFFALLLYV